jgi:L-amino acid N-acyltransferase YncA
MTIIRRATIKDLAAITDVYNEAILKTVATFDTQPKTIREQKLWFESHDSKHPILLAEQDGVAVGWASLSKWSDRCAYSDTAEISIYVKEEHRGKRIGTKLMNEIINEGRKTGIHTIIARIADSNEASVRLHESAGFKHIGTMKEVGRKFGKLIDVYLMQKIYES